MPTGDSPTHDLPALTRLWFAEVWNKGREEVIEQMTAPDARARGLAQGERELVGPAAFKEFYRPMKSALPDIDISIDDVITQGDQTCCRLTACGTHAGDGLGVPPTGRKVSFTALVWIRWKDGKIAEAWNEFDSSHLLAQIAGATGAAPTTATVKPR